MATQSVEALIEGGKATAAPPLGPALGPLKVNIGQVVAAINEKTKAMAGMQVPVKVIVDSDTKEFEIEIGTPPAAALILKEAEVAKGAGNPKLDKVADLKIEQIIKIAKMKEDALLGADLKGKVKEIIGTCRSMGILVEGVDTQKAIENVNAGKYDEEIKSEKTELSEEDRKKLEEEKKKLQADLEERRKKLEAKAKEIISLNKSKEGNKIKAIMVENKVPIDIIEKVLAEAGIVIGGKEEKKS